jgi:hypothetical protein
MSSARGELHGQTAATIMTKQLLHTNNAMQTMVHFYGDNQSVQNKCTTCHTHKLKNHREPNIDMLLEYQNATRNMTRQVHWVGSHQDDRMAWENNTELLELKLSQEAMLNVWCDKMADKARRSHQSYPDADVLPTKNGSSSPVPPLSTN